MAVLRHPVHGRGAAARQRRAVGSRLHLTLPGRALTSAGAARRYVRETARSWGMPSGTTDDLETITGELVVNALEHTEAPPSRSPVLLPPGWQRSASPTRARGIRRCGPRAWQCRQSRSGSYGRGLLIIDALADRW
ncbi:ATP-binding protein [Streptomyces gossypiisoli]|uniref:ATP-binding protein n=1 Tax=Streptomyces gossypiisoli TaxID=2748864 RepID=UPI0038CD6F74